MNDKSKTKTQLISELAQLRKKVTELESSEDDYRNLFANMPVGIFQSTPDGQYRRVNSAFAHMTGFSSPEEMLNEVKDISTLYDDPSDREEVKRLFAEQGQLNGHVIRHKQKDGQLRWMTIYAKSVYNDAGASFYYDGFTLDITERKLAEEALIASEVRYRRLFESAQDAILILDATSGAIVDANPFVEKLLEYPVDGMLGKQIWQISPFQDIIDNKSRFQELQEHKFVRYEDLPLQTQSGKTIFVEFVSNVYLVDGAEVIQCNIRDITARKRADEALNLSQTDLKKAQQVAHLGSWKWYIQSNQLEWSDEMYRVFGIDKKNFINDLGDVISSVIHPDDRVKVEQSNLAVISDSQTAPLEYRVIWPDGSIRVVRAEASELIFDEAGNPAVLTGIAQDITERKKDQEVLRKSEERFKAIFLQSPIAIELFDANGLLVEANKKCLELFGVEDIQHVKGFNLFNDPNIPVTELEKLIKGEQISFTSEFDFEVVKKENLYPTSKSEKMIWDVFVKVLLDENGVISGYLVQVQDLTERKQTENALQASENQFRRAVTDSPVPIMIHDDDDNILQLSKGWTDYSGYTIEDIPTMSAWTEKAYGSSTGTEKKYIDQLFEINKTIENGEWTIHAKDGSKRIWEFMTTPLGKNAKGKRLLHSMAVDITERKQAEHAQKQMTLLIQQQANQLQMVMDSVPEGVFVIGSSGRIILANPRANNDLSALADGHGVGDIVTELGGQPINVWLTRPPGGLWHQISWQNQSFELIAKPLKDSNTAEGWVLVIRDVTAEKEIQAHIQQQARLASVGQLAAGIAHDFNNILAVISLYADLSLRDQRLPADMLKRFNTIKTQSGRAADLISQILDFSRRSVLERLPMDFIPFLKELVKLFERTLPENITIHLGYTEDNFIVNGDPTRLQQVFMNLIVNARDAMPSGGRLQINLERKNPGRIDTGMLPDRSIDWVCLTVQDTGPGISADVLPHIFEPFYTTKEPGKGTGLGLAQVFGIIKQHDGEIDVVTEVGEGSTFIIYLPMLAAPDSKDEIIESEKLPLGQGETILVVEDNPGMQQVIIDSLANLNYRALTASNGREALEILNERGNEIALVLTDLVMPEMGGKLLLETMNQADMTTKVIIMTGHPMGDEKELLLALGAVDWLDKPPSLEALAQVLANALA